MTTPSDRKRWAENAARVRRHEALALAVMAHQGRIAPARTVVALAEDFRKYIEAGEQPQ